MTNKCFVIAEAGSTHDGDLQKAIRLVHAATDCQASAVKFQWCSSPEQLAQRRNAGEYVKHYKLISFDRKWFDVLKAEADKCGIEWMCTVYLPEDIPVIAPYVSRFKVASFEAEDSEFVQAHAEYGKQIISSLGMGAVGSYAEGADLRYLHCVSAYPAPADQMNLRRIRDDELDGLSDHSRVIEMGANAVFAGAEILETHIRLFDTSPANADYGHSFYPAEYTQYVKKVREAGVILGDGSSEAMPCEEAMMKFKVKA